MSQRSDSALVRIVLLMRVLDAALEVNDAEPLLENKVLISALNADQKQVREIAEWIEGIAESKRDERLQKLTIDQGDG